MAAIACVVGECTEAATLRCSQCKSAYYCSEAHQRVDWQHGGHRAVCQAVDQRIGDPPSDDDDSYDDDSPGGGSPPSRKRPSSSDNPTAKLPAHTRARALRAVNDALAVIARLRANPPQTNNYDFMAALHELSGHAVEAANAAAGDQLPIRGTMVPLRAYLDPLERARTMLVGLQQGLSDGALPPPSSREFDALVVQVNKVVRHVREILLNPDVWLAWYDARRHRASPNVLSGLPPEAVALMARAQTPIQLGAFVRALSADTDRWWRAVRLQPLGDAAHPVVSAGTVYRFFENHILVEGAVAPSYPASGPPGPNLFGIGLSGEGAFLPGLHGSLWQITERVAANFRWYAGEWHLISRASIPPPPNLSVAAFPIGVDRYNRLWIMHGPRQMSVLHTDEVTANPRMTTWPLAGELGRLHSPVMTARGVVAYAYGGMVCIDVDDQNRPRLERLAEMTRALWLDNPFRSGFCFAGDRASTQVVMVDSVRSVFQVWDLKAGTPSREFGFEGGPGHGNAAKLARVAVHHDGRSLLLSYNNKNNSGGPDKLVYRVAVVP